MALITLTTDIGIHDFVPGAIKGQLYGENESFKVIDITNLLSPFNYIQASYVCKNVINNFPEGTMHVILVNVFDKKKPHMLFAEHNGQYIGCADNGLLTMILDEAPQKVVTLPYKENERVNIFSCTKLLAEAYNKIVQGKTIEQVGYVGAEIVVTNPLRPILGANWMDGQIIFIDNFENIIINITQKQFEDARKGRAFKIVFKRSETIDRISDTYSDVAEGEKLAIFNAAGYLEIAINKGNAAGLLGLQGFTEMPSGMPSQVLNNRLVYQTVKIHFED